jgi:hypothetical protein
MDNVGIVVEDITAAIEFFTDWAWTWRAAPRSKESGQGA